METRNKRATLPIIHILKTSIKLPFLHFGQLLRVGIPLLVVYAALLALQLIPLFEEMEDGIFLRLIVFGLFVTWLAAATMAVVGCHRVFLMDENSVRSMQIIRWTLRESEFLWRWIKINVVAFLAVLPFFLIIVFPLLHFGESWTNDTYIFPLLIIVVIGVPFYYALSRWSLLLPATAIDQGFDISEAWKLSQGNGFQLTVLIGVIPSMTSIILQLLPLYESTIYSILVYVLWHIIVVIEIGILSISYKWIADHS